MDSITKAIDRIDKIIASIDYNYVRIEIESRREHYLLEKNKQNSIGFKSGG